MKKFYMTMAAMLCGVAAMAENYLYGNPVQCDAGATADFEICLRNDREDLTALSFRLEFPEGVSMALNKKGKKYVTIDEDRTDGHSAIIQDAADGNDMISIYEASKALFYENDGVIVTVPIKVAEGTADASTTIRIYTVSISSTDPMEGNQCDQDKRDVTAELTIGNGTGINSINAADSKAPVYNLAGQRVSKAQQGVFIQNGKKIATK